MSGIHSPAGRGAHDVAASLECMHVETMAKSCVAAVGPAREALLRLLSGYDRAVRETDPRLERLLVAQECLSIARLPRIAISRILSSCAKVDPVRHPNREKAVIDSAMAKAYIKVAEEVCPEDGLEPSPGRGCALTPWESADWNAVHAFSFAQKALEVDPGYTPALLLRYQAMEVTVKSGALSQIRRKVAKLSEDLHDHEKRCHMCTLHTSYACLMGYKAGLMSQTEVEFHLHKLRDRLVQCLWREEVVSLNVSCEVSQFKVPIHNGESVMDTLLSEKHGDFLIVAASPVNTTGTYPGCIWWVHLRESQDPSKVLKTCLKVLQAAGGQVCALQYGQGMPLWQSASDTAVALDHESVRTSLGLDQSVVVSSQGLGCGKSSGAALERYLPRRDPRDQVHCFTLRGHFLAVSNDVRRKLVMRSVVGHLRSLGAPFRSDLY